MEWEAMTSVRPCPQYTVIRSVGDGWMHAEGEVMSVLKTYTAYDVSMVMR